MCQRQDDGSRMSREAHVRFCEGPRVKLPWSTHPYIWTWEGWLYLAVVIDVFSRKVVGWSFGESLVVGALNMALITRKPGDVIHHSDHGSQYTSVEFGKRCREMGVRPSMGSVGDAYDNAMAESFFARLECELIDRRSWKNKTEARLAIFTWIESWYNPTRRHSGLGYLSPSNFEKKLKEENQLAIDNNSGKQVEMLSTQ